METRWQRSDAEVVHTVTEGDGQTVMSASKGRYRTIMLWKWNLLPYIALASTCTDGGAAPPPAHKKKKVGSGQHFFSRTVGGGNDDAECKHDERR